MYVCIIHNYPISELTILIYMHGLDTYSAGTYTHLYVCMHACMYVCMYVCMVFIYMHGLGCGAYTHLYVCVYVYI